LILRGTDSARPKDATLPALDRQPFVAVRPGFGADFW
jgi:hypothetical protein